MKPRLWVISSERERHERLLGLLNTGSPHNGARKATSSFRLAFIFLIPQGKVEVYDEMMSYLERRD